MNYTQRQFDRAKLARKLYHNVGTPTVQNFKALLNLYMTTITLSTVGYGETIQELEHNPPARIFTIFLIFIGIGILMYVLSISTAFLVEGQLSEILRRRKMEKTLSRTKYPSVTRHFVPRAVHLHTALRL